jgi:transposase
MESMDAYRQFFLKPESTHHRRYETLKAYFVERHKAKDIAKQFGLSHFTVYSLIRDFKESVDRSEPMQFFVETKTGPKTDRKKPGVREHVLRLRARGYADTDIHKALQLAGFKVSVSLIDQILQEEGLVGLSKRSRGERERVKAEIKSGSIPGLTCPQQAAPEVPVVADVNELDLQNDRTVYSRVAGVFLFVPFLVQLGLDKIVAAAELPGTKMIPAVSYVLSLLALKLLDKERKSHISDWNFDQALGWFAGLNILPKNTATTDYTYRLLDGEHNRLLVEWVRQAYPILCPESAAAFAIDFHTIAHRGENTTLEKHYVPLRGKAVKSIQTCFARAVDSPMLCYANADIVRDQQQQIPLRFVDYWKNITGLKPQWLYFDSKMTTYSVLDQLHQDGINFITIRRRGAGIIRKILNRAKSDWTSVVIDTKQRRHQRIRYLDDLVKLPNYTAACRQITTDGLGRSVPTLFLTNNEDISGKEVITRYISRNSIENELGINVNFFHLDCLASEVRLNVHTDVVMTVLANGCYRWLSRQLKSCQKMEPKQLYRKFVETAGHVRVNGKKIIVCFDRRSHNPIIAQAGLDSQEISIPWLEGKSLRFEFK